MSDDTFITDTLRARYARRNSDKTRDRSEAKIYASSAGDVLEVRDVKYGKSAPSGCARKVYLDFFPEQSTPEAQSFESTLNTELGNAFHGMLARELHEEGVLVRDEYALKRFEPDTSSRWDWLVMHPTRGLCIVDGKSMSTWAFKNLSGPKPGDIAQVMHYLDMTKLRWGCLVYYQKESGRIKEYWFQYDAEIASAWRESVKALRAKVLSDKALGVFSPPAIPVGVKASAWPCSWGKEGARCRHFAFCHGAKATESESEEDDFTLKG